LNPVNPANLYGGGDEGFTDYPTYSNVIRESISEGALS
jgi:hypothetical protein